MKNIAKKYIIKIPKNLSVFYSEKKRIITIVGPLKKKSLKLKTQILISSKQNLLGVTSQPFQSISLNESKQLKVLQGTTVALLKQAILEVSILFCKKLQFTGVGYRAFLLKVANHELLQFKLGYSHNIYFKVSDNITIFCLKSDKVFISGNFYEYVSQIASLIRSYKKPEPYKGKGILYENEKILLKEGKKV
jgi:large subunit ribosomal protein L6